MRFNPVAFNEFIDEVGQRFIWSRGSRCPCVSAHSGAARPGCAQCGGKGTIWREGVRCKAGVAGQKSQKQWADFGNYEAGDMVLIIHEASPMYSIGSGDKVVALDNYDRLSIVLVRGQNDDLIPAIHRVDRVFWLDGNEQIVEGWLPTVDEDGVIQWGDYPPPAGVTYTIEGTKYLEYHCYGRHPSDRNQHSGERLPRNVVLRRFDTFKR